jgi:protocatechuate 3,4-dioxygenase alpha subunit
MSMQRSASQTVGPFFLESLLHSGDEIVAKAGAVGEQIIVEGKVFDAEGNTVNDAIVEIFQADATGRYVADSAAARSASRFSGFGRAGTDQSGRFRFVTVYPGTVRMAGGTSEAPHLDAMVFARGLLKPLVTRIYFAGDPANAQDPVLALVPVDRRHTLEARQGAGSKPAVWHFDVRLQGRGETVFFDF